MNLYTFPSPLDEGWELRIRADSEQEAIAKLREQRSPTFMAKKGKAAWTFTAHWVGVQ